MIFVISSSVRSKQLLCVAHDKALSACCKQKRVQQKTHNHLLLLAMICPSIKFHTVCYFVI